MKLRIIGPNGKCPKGYTLINTTSRSNDFGRGLSPFFLGPVKLYDNFKAHNVENAWQYSKVYSKHDDGGVPNSNYFSWATSGWNKVKADRYPMGKGALPEYSFWDGESLDYISARRKIYIPLYATAVSISPAFKRLQKLFKTDNICLWDFDGYDYKEMDTTLLNVMNDPSRKMGHAFVLAMMLAWGPNFYKR